MDPIDILLSRGVDSIYPDRKTLEKVLRSGKKLTLYQGFDPTGNQLHIGHAVAIRKLRQFQDLGHRVIFLIGDGTGQAGDPTGKMKARGRFMTREELRKNASDYVSQASRIVRFDGENPVEVKWNADWLEKLGLRDILGIAEHFTVQQLLERDMFRERMGVGEPVILREFLYPVLQGYDSVAMNVDLEIGGTDQMFNMMAGRHLVSAMLGKEKFVMTVPLLTDARGVKIGKTEGNVIGLTDGPADFYAKIMSLSDDGIFPCFELLTDIPMEEIASMREKAGKGENPMGFKKKLAHTLTAYLNTPEEADEAQRHFETVVQGRAVSDQPAEHISLQDAKPAGDLAAFLTDNGLVASKSEAKRLLGQGAVEIDGTRADSTSLPAVKPGAIMKVGKKRFIKFDP